MTGGHFGHAVADGEGISLIDLDGERLSVRGDPTVSARVVDFAAGSEAPTHDLELAVRVRDEEELEKALAELDPELLVLAGTLEEVLDLLPDVPAGKLAIADLPSLTEEDVDELERAGFDAAIASQV